MVLPVPKSERFLCFFFLRVAFSHFFLYRLPSWVGSFSLILLFFHLVAGIAGFCGLSVQLARYVFVRAFFMHSMVLPLPNI